MSICGEIENLERTIWFLQMKLGSPDFYNLDKKDLAIQLEEAEKIKKELESL